MPSLVKADLSLFAKATMAIAQVKFVMLTATDDWHGYLVFIFAIATTRIQDLDPLEDVAQIIVVRACITDYCTTQGSWNDDTKLKPTPAERCDLMHQTGQTDTGISDQKTSTLTLVLYTISTQSDTCDDASNTRISIEDICAIAGNEQGIMFFCT